MAGIIPADKLKAIMDICTAYEDSDALELAGRLMEDPAIRMHGPEHHFLTAAAILTAYANKYCPKSKYRFLKMASHRTVRIPVAVCAIYGTCGALMGAGTAVSITIPASPSAAETLQIVNKATASIQNELSGYNGIRCCKRSAWASVKGALGVLNTCEGISMPVSDICCHHSFKHNACIGKRCPYCHCADA